MTTKITKSLLESVSNVLSGKTLKESYAYIDKNNVPKSDGSTIDKFEDLIASELDISIPSDELKDLYALFKKGAGIAVAVEGQGHAKQLKKDGFKLGNFSGQKDMDGNMQEIYIKEKGFGIKEEAEEDKLEEARSQYKYLDKKNVEKSSYSNLDQFEAFVLGELVDAPVDSDDAQTLFNLFKKGYTIAVEVEGQGHAKELKKDGFTKANTAGFRDENDKLVYFWSKATSGK